MAYDNRTLSEEQGGEGRAGLGQRGSLTLERGLRVLRLLAAHPEGLSVSGIASALGTHRAGVYRLLEPLTGQRFVSRDSSGLYTLDIGLVELASAVRPRLQTVAAPLLQQLADEIGVTTALTIRDGEEAVLLSVFEPRSSHMYIGHRPGLRHRLDQAAAGLAILAGQPARPGEREAVTEARGRGWAVTFGEVIPGVTGIGAPLTLGDARLQASVSAVWLDDRDLEQAAAALVRRAQAISNGFVAGVGGERSEVAGVADSTPGGPRG